MTVKRGGHYTRDKNGVVKRLGGTEAAQHAASAEQSAEPSETAPSETPATTEKGK